MQAMRGFLHVLVAQGRHRTEREGDGSPPYILTGVRLHGRRGGYAFRVLDSGERSEEEEQSEDDDDGLADD